MYAAKISKRNLEGIMSLLVHIPSNVNQDELINHIEHIKISQSKYEKMRNKFYNNTSNLDNDGRFGSLFNSFRSAFKSFRLQSVFRPFEDE